MDQIIQLHFFEYLDIHDYLNLLLTNKFFYHNYNCDMVYKMYLEQIYSTNFIINLKYVMINYRDSFKRIYIFNAMCKQYNYDLWVEPDFYQFWKYKYSTNKAILD